MKKAVRLFFISCSILLLNAQPDAKLNLELYDKLKNSLVEIKFYFAIDYTGLKNDGDIRYFCPNCKSYHSTSLNEYIKTERPVVLPGFALSKDTFITTDATIPKSRLAKIEIVFNDKIYEGILEGIYPQQSALRIKSKKEIDNIEGLDFKSEAKGDLYYFYRVEENGSTILGIEKYSERNICHNLTLKKDFFKTLPSTLLVNKNGEVATIIMKNEFFVEENSKENPRDWEFLSLSAYNSNLEEINDLVEKNVFPVEIRFKQAKNVKPMARRDYSRGEQNEEQIYGFAVTLGNGEFLLKAEISADKVNKIDRINMFVKEKVFSCEYISGFNDFNLFLISCKDQILGEGLKFYPNKNISSFMNKILIAVKIENFGKKMLFNVSNCYIEKLEPAYQGLNLPEISGNNNQSWIFTNKGELVLMPVPLRNEDNDNNNKDDEILLPFELVNEKLRNKDFDPVFSNNNANIKNSGYFGIEYQTLTPKLAQVNNAAEFTKNGEEGLLVSGVLKKSPADISGIKIGDVLTGILNEKKTKIIRFKKYNFNTYGQDFPWDRYDEIGAEFFAEIPQPWAVEPNKLDAMAKNFGVGKDISFIIARKGKLDLVPVKIIEMPKNFNDAEKYNDSELGISVCDITAEVRNYFRLDDKASGIIISKVRPGMKGAVSGLKPYEMITQVDGIDIFNIDEFKKAVENKAEISLNIRRHSISRVIKINLSKIKGQK